MENNPIASGAKTWSRLPSPAFGRGHSFRVHDRWRAQPFRPTSESDELRALLRPYDARLMEAYAVSRAVSSVKNDNEECIERIGEPKLDPISGAS
jgi:hypothetical protein